MQLIIETENRDIDVKEKMSTIEQGSLADKILVNGIPEPGVLDGTDIDLPNGNKENIETIDNIVDDPKLNLNECQDKQVIEEPVTENVSESQNKQIANQTSTVNEDVSPNKGIEDQAVTSNTNNIASEICSEEIDITNVKEESQSDIEEDEAITGNDPIDTCIGNNEDKITKMSDENVEDIVKKEHDTCLQTEASDETVKLELLQQNTCIKMEVGDEIAIDTTVNEQNIKLEVGESDDLVNGAIDNKEQDACIRMETCNEKVDVFSSKDKGDCEQMDVSDVKTNTVSFINEQSTCVSVDNGTEKVYDNDFNEEDACMEIEQCTEKINDIVNTIQNNCEEMDVSDDRVNDSIVNREQDAVIEEETRVPTPQIDHKVGTTEKIDLDTRIANQEEKSVKDSKQETILESDINLKENILIDPETISNISNDKIGQSITTSVDTELRETNSHLEDNTSIAIALSDKENSLQLNKDNLEKISELVKDDLETETNVESSEITQLVTNELSKKNFLLEDNNDSKDLSDNGSDVKAKEESENEVMQPETDSDGVTSKIDKNSTTIIVDSPHVVEIDEAEKVPSIDSYKTSESATDEKSIESKDIDEIKNTTDIAIKGQEEPMDCDNVTVEIDMLADKNEEQNVSDNDVNQNSANTIVTSEIKDTVTSVVDNVEPVTSQKEEVVQETSSESKEKIMDDDGVKVIADKQKSPETTKSKTQEKVPEKKITQTIRLSNTLDILSDDDDELDRVEEVLPQNDTEKQCINIDDDDDIMLIDEDTVNKDTNETSKDVGDKDKLLDALEVNSDKAFDALKSDSDKAFDTLRASNDNVLISDTDTIKLDDDPKKSEVSSNPVVSEKESTVPDTGHIDVFMNPEINEKVTEVTHIVKQKPLVADDFFKTYKKNLTDMTRDDLEEFCILKIVESIIDRSNLTELRSKFKTMTQHIDDYKKKAMMLTKQNRDLQVVLKSVQEEQKKTNHPITPLKITRSVGMQVLMTDKGRKKGPVANAATGNINIKAARNTVGQYTRQQSQANNAQPIPVPRLVPAATVNNVVIKPPVTPPVNVVKPPAKTGNSTPNGVKNSPPAPKVEKRPHGKMMTVDLTDDEPPAKVATRSLPPPVRLVAPQNLLAPRQQVVQTVNQPRKVYIPISQSQSQNIRPGQTIMLRSVPPAGPRHRGPVGPMVRIPQNTVRMARAPSGRHPAPLPEFTKQYQPPNLKALPPAPDLKLSKVENGIVISWKIEGYQEDSYEEIASYQLYAYQETSAPPNTSLWKKIGDVKALPLPMACTLTQFMAGYKYYFAVRAVDVRSRLGPFSLPGSILLLNKM